MLQIVDYQESGVMAPLKNAARNRRYWVDNFHEINRRAVERWDGWPSHWVIPAEQRDPVALDAVLRILTFGSVEVHRAEQPFSVATRSFQKPGTWYGSGAPAAPFDVQDPHIRIVARYGEEEPRLSGWVLGSEHIAGEPAIVEAPVGRGSVVLFGFQPNYRGQTSATWPLLFNAMQR